MSRRDQAMAAACAAYILAASAVMLRAGFVATPDYLLLLMTPLAIVTGRAHDWFRDWVPFVALLLLWEGMRSFAGEYALSGVHLGSLRLERQVFGPALPSVELQSLAMAAGPAVRHFVDVLVAVVDLSHFPATLTIALLIWMRGRDAFALYSVALFGTAFTAFVIFLLAPTAPPWWAADHGQIAGLRHVMAEVMPVRWSGYYRSLDPNPVAADPSLHSALPFVGFLVLWRLRSPIAWPVLGWSIAVWLSVVYLGEHYVFDVVAGTALAAIWSALAGSLATRSRRRAADPIAHVGGERRLEYLDRLKPGIRDAVE